MDIGIYETENLRRSSVGQKQVVKLKFISNTMNQFRCEDMRR